MEKTWLILSMIVVIFTSILSGCRKSTTIVGTLVNSDGAKLFPMDLCLENLSNIKYEASHTATTDEEGLFTFPCLFPNSNYRVFLCPNQSNMKFYNEYTGLIDCPAISPDQFKSGPIGATVTLPDPLAVRVLPEMIQGTLLDYSGKTYSNVSICANESENPSSGESQPLKTATDESGNFEFLDLYPDRTYRLTICGGPLQSTEALNADTQFRTSVERQLFRIRFLRRGGNAVFDTKLQKTWRKCSAQIMSYAEAEKYIDEVSWKEQTPWELPSSNDASSLGDNSADLPSEYFDVHENGFWTFSSGHGRVNPHRYARLFSYSKQPNLTDHFFDLHNDKDRFHVCAIRAK